MRSWCVHLELCHWLRKSFKFIIHSLLVPFLDSIDSQEKCQALKKINAPPPPKVANFVNVTFASGQAAHTGFISGSFFFFSFFPFPWLKTEGHWEQLEWGRPKSKVLFVLKTNSLVTFLCWTLLLCSTLKLICSIVTSVGVKLADSF